MGGWGVGVPESGAVVVLEWGEGLEYLRVGVGGGGVELQRGRVAGERRRGGGGRVNKEVKKLGGGGGGGGGVSGAARNGLVGLEGDGNGVYVRVVSDVRVRISDVRG